VDGIEKFSVYAVIGREMQRSYAGRGSLVFNAKLEKQMPLFTITAIEKTLSHLCLIPALLVVAASAAQVIAQVQTNVPEIIPGAKPVSVEHIKIHGAALEGNLEGDAIDRDVIVFLPPSYANDKKRRYPVVYALHGYSIGAEQWTHEIHVPQTIEGAFAQGSHEMIVVLPDSKTIYNGSMYSSSATTGDFENYIAHDVVGYVDEHYRTIPNRASRGLVGHSMGGYGASRIGMKHSDVFGVLYIMSPCCLSPMTGGGPGPSDKVKDRAIVNEKKVDGAKSPAELAAESPGFGSVVFATAAAWAPDPKNPPLYFDLPTKDGDPQPEVMAKFAANAPLAFVDQYIGNLKQYRAIAMDVGDQDGLRVDAGKLHDLFDRYGLVNTFEIYSGTHVSAVADRFQNHVLPFFSKNLCFTAYCR
jgi:pimeloyl-ACP methyl ester carboxylesterase